MHIQLFHEYYQNNQFRMTVITLISLLLNFFLTTILKGQYFIDNFGGLTLGSYLWIISRERLSYYIDSKVFGMTLFDRYPHVQTKCSNPFK